MTSCLSCRFRKLRPSISGNSGRGWLGRVVEVKFEMSGPVGRTSEFEVLPALERPVEDHLGQVRIIEDTSPRPHTTRDLLGREDHGPAVEMALIHDQQEHIARVRVRIEFARAWRNLIIISEPARRMP
jgi:hypothetical protein